MPRLALVMINKWEWVARKEHRPIEHWNPQEMSVYERWKRPQLVCSFGSRDYSSQASEIRKHCRLEFTISALETKAGFAGEIVGDCPR